MELHQLRYFVAAAESGSFTRAAKQCKVAQPSLSQQIKKLERSVEKSLFDRMGRRAVRLTESGRELLGRARAILSAVDEAGDAIRNDSKARATGRVAIGALPSVAPYLLPALLKRFTRKFRDASVEPYEDGQTQLIAALHAGELEMAVVALPLDEERLDCVELLTEPLVAAVPSKHRLAKKRSVSAAALAAEPFILLDEVHSLGDQTMTYFRQQGAVPKIIGRAAQISTVQTLVGLGLGVSLLPAMASKSAPGGRVVHRTLSDPAPSRTLGLVWRRERHSGPIARQLRDAMSE